MGDGREQALAASLQHMRDRIDLACAEAGRDSSEVHLIVVTKTWPVDDVRRLADLGVRDMGENRDQEAKAKAAATPDLDITWHFIGQLQTNKANSVARYADVIHSVDRPELVAALERGAERADRTLTCLIQVDLEDGAARGRGGAAPSEVAALARAIEEAPHLRLGGIMGVAPLDEGDQPVASAAAFARLAHIHRELLADHPGASILSAGMSGDLEQAVAAGATHLRVGSAVLGDRPPLG
jgi:pyridoxal phosphate enzyme (YggS family)